MVTLTFPEWLVWGFVILMGLMAANEILKLYLRYLKWRISRLQDKEL